MTNARYWIDRLELEPHKEGGYLKKPIVLPRTSGTMHCLNGSVVTDLFVLRSIFSSTIATSQLFIASSRTKCGTFILEILC